MNSDASSPHDGETPPPHMKAALGVIIFELTYHVTRLQAINEALKMYGESLDPKGPLAKPIQDLENRRLSIAKAMGFDVTTKGGIIQP